MRTNTPSVRAFIVLGLLLQCVNADPENSDDKIPTTTVSTTSITTEPLKTTISSATPTPSTVSSTEKKPDSPPEMQTTTHTTQPVKKVTETTHSATDKSTGATSTESSDSKQETTQSPTPSQPTTSAQAGGLTESNIKSSKSTSILKPSMQTSSKTASTESPVTTPTQPMSSQNSESTTNIPERGLDPHPVAETTSQSYSPTAPPSKSETASSTATSINTVAASSTAATTSSTASASATLTATKMASSTTIKATLSTTSSSTTSTIAKIPEPEVIINGSPSYNSPKLPSIRKVCTELLKKIQMGPTGKCSMNINEDTDELKFTSIELSANPAMADQIYSDIMMEGDKNKSKSDDDEIPKTMIAILASVGALVLILLLFAIYCSYHRRSYRKNQQHLTEELQTVENGYHDNPTLEVMEVQPEMQEKKLALNGEFNDSWIVPFDNLIKEDIPDEEDTHL